MLHSPLLSAPRPGELRELKRALNSAEIEAPTPDEWTFPVQDCGLCVLGWKGTDQGKLFPI